MQEQTVFGGMQPPTPIKKRHVILRTMGIGLVAALAIITIVSFTLFSTVLHTGTQVHIKPSTNTGAAGAGYPQKQQQRAFTPTLVCHVGDIMNGPSGWDAELGWSSQGQVVAAGLLNFQIASAQNCQTTSSKNIKSFTYKWSPDGKKLLTIDKDHQAFNVLDSHGNTLVSLSFAQLGVSEVASTVWSSDSTSLIFAGQAQNQSVIKSVNIVTSNVRILGTLSTRGISTLSPNGKFLLIYGADKSTQAKGAALWDINSGKQIDLLPSITSVQNFMETVFSPDSSQIMLLGSSQVSIYATATGKLQSSFANTNSVPNGPGLVLAWSPDGKYLAEGSNKIRIYDVQTHQMVASFGQVDAQHLIATLVWSPDGKGLISATGPSDFSATIPIAVNVWRLS